jgi:CheY-like chemotaxis protein
LNINHPYILIADDDYEMLERYRLLLGLPDEACSSSTLDKLDDFISSLGEPEESTPEAPWEATLVEQGFDAIHTATQAKQQGTSITHAFLDMRMPPGMDGLQTAARLRELYPQIKIIFVSAYIDHSTEEMDRVLGKAHWHFLQKPFKDEDILKLLP